MKKFAALIRRYEVNDSCYSQAITGSRDFETYTVNLDSYPEGLDTMYIFLMLDGTSAGTAYFDDISLVSHH